MSFRSLWFVRLLRPILLLNCCLLFAPLSLAQNVINVPSTPALNVEQERQVQRIGQKIHCPICSGESIAQSQTDIARQMLNEVRESLRQGKTEAEILQQFSRSYGERILLEPPKQGINWVLWGLPMGLTLLGAGFWWRFIHNASHTPHDQLQLSAEEEARIAELLAETQQPEAQQSEPQKHAPIATESQQ